MFAALAVLSLGTTAPSPGQAARRRPASHGPGGRHRAAPSAPMVRCTSPKAQPAGSRASIRRPGQITTFASGLPTAIPVVGIGGAIDVAFIGKTAYVLVTLVGSDVGGSDVDGIYRVDGPDSFTVVADIGAFAVANPPTIPFPI